MFSFWVIGINISASDGGKGSPDIDNEVLMTVFGAPQAQ